MLVTGFPAAAFGTNCFVVAPGPGEHAVVVDPGVEVVDQLDEVLREHRLQPVAVLLTHGHIDHTFSVTPVCGARGIPAYIHPGDDRLLADPMSRHLARDGRALRRSAGVERAGRRAVRSTTASRARARRPARSPSTTRRVTPRARSRSGCPATTYRR